MNWSEQIEALRREVAELRAQQRDLTTELRGDFYLGEKPRMSMEEYWARHNVTSHRRFASAEESLAHFHERNALYPGYIDLLPVTGWDGKVVLDYGCGPGNDLVGIANFSPQARLIGIDISASSLTEAEQRLALHGQRAELVNLPYGTYDIPLENASVDYVHCSGVLMLIEDPVRLLREFRRVLKPTGELRLMVYNYDSLWMHLYVAYVVRIENYLYADVSLRDAFSRTTDGEDCPFVQVWRPSEMTELAVQAGYDCRYLGAALSLWELHLLPKRFRAAMHPRLEPESRDFLLALEFDRRGFPLYRGTYAGIDGCYQLKPHTGTKTGGAE